MSEVEMALITIRFDGEPSIDTVAKMLRVEPEDIDAEFGFVPIDRDGRFAVRVRADRVGRADSREFDGPFSDPEIGPCSAHD